MKRALVILATCGTPTAAPKVTSRPVPIDATVAIDASLGAAPVVHTSPSRSMIEAPHGGAITTLAVTADGKAAITCDDLGGMRLWPTLDGTQEPRVVDLQAPRALAIGRHGDGFAVVLLDDVGGLVIATLDSSGRTLHHVSIGGDPAYVGVAMTERGPLGWRTDQAIVQLSVDGVATSRLAPDPSQRLANLAVSYGPGGEHALAVIDVADDAGVTTRRARWLQLATLTWGAWLDSPELGPSIALSPSGKRVALMVRMTGTTGIAQARILDAATGKTIATLGARPATSVGFYDDDHVGFATPGAVAAVEITPGGTIDPKQFEPVPLQREPSVAFAAGMAVFPHDGELQLATPTENHWLGYELESPAVAASAPHGGLVIGLDETFALLDPSLHAIGTPDILVTKDTRVAELHWLGGDDWLVESSAQSDGSTTLSLIDIAAKKATVLRSGVPVVQLMLYERSTNLVTLSLGEAPTIDRYNNAKHKLDHIATLPKPNGFEQRELAPVSPTLADGAQLVSIQMRDRMTLRWVRDLAALDTGPNIAVDGSLAGVDPAGHVFVWQTTGNNLELVVYSAGKRTGTLPADGMVALWPDPGGSRVVETGGANVTLIDIDGTKKWTIPVQSATEALWLDDGGLALVSAAGLARVDPATGAITAARCGWRFGLATKPHPPAPRVEPVCMQLLER